MWNTRNICRISSFKERRTTCRTEETTEKPCSRFWPTRSFWSSAKRTSVFTTTTRSKWCANDAITSCWVLWRVGCPRLTSRYVCPGRIYSARRLVSSNCKNKRTQRRWENNFLSSSKTSKESTKAELARSFSNLQSMSSSTRDTVMALNGDIINTTLLTLAPIRKAFFRLDEKSNYYWFTPTTLETEKEFRLVGMLFGIAIYNNVLLDVQFPPVFFRKLCGKLGTLEDLFFSHHVTHRDK